MTMRSLTTDGMQQIRALLAPRCDDRLPDTRDMFAVLRMGARSPSAVAGDGRGAGRRRVAAIAQGGLFFATKALKPKWSRLNPFQGLKRMFGPHALWEGVKMILKSTLVGSSSGTPSSG